jgi:hypothetical protein
MTKIKYIEALPWSRSNMDEHTLQGLVAGSQLTANTDRRTPAWIIALSEHQEPHPPEGYVVSFARLHERGFNTLANRFMRGLCYHYDVEMHNFNPNAISQAVTFVAICEGFLGVPAQWDLWIHLFRGELFTMPAGAMGTRRLVRVGGLTFALRERGYNMYPRCKMMTNNSDWHKGWFYVRNDGAGLPAYTGKVFTDRVERWAYRLPPSTRQKVAPYLDALRTLTQTRLNAAAVIAQFHRQRVIPLMERTLPIFAMVEGVAEGALQRLRLVAEPLRHASAVDRARHALDTTNVLCVPDKYCG